MNQPLSALIFRLTRIDRCGLVACALVFLFFLVVWLLLILAAGSAPTGRLTAVCVRWVLSAELVVVLPGWALARCGRFVAAFARRAVKQHMATVRLGSYGSGWPADRVSNF